MLKLSADMLLLLRECLESRRPDLLWVLNNEININETLGNELRDIVNEEFLEKGLNDDEPNELGIKLERLIDEIGRCFM
ncbi:hypothetical protein NSS70_15750 [Aeribacillus sp. FSL K6-2848]|jgi:hypothetical protein|uniref:Uncharacterized protein n=1 Tax=Aeribacillus pallidus TaxID=33936 RepID=A0A223E2R0_9BACI|nr:MULTISPECIES: hypothetical protein [Aeribacillus]ASS88879.1 hypothetical protein AP3564_00150 [Aeribacillus pallidus]ASS89425.1 hypothetical protein AP3564_03370 [Aeribacillus pallidus]KZM57706.1 hypothetical protein A3Q35_18615 [Aeribacillus pallidus]MDR9796737.1 hypothetical protein [Aeribacillus pallidus]MED0652458.1 hypothetical protein [Aeribacillus composti]